MMSQTARLNASNPRLADASSERRRLIAEMDLRIVRQQRRIEKIILERSGPREEMEALLGDMIEARDLMREQDDRLQDVRRGPADDVWPAIDATSPSKG